jgi:hypothetical protein
MVGLGLVSRGWHATSAEFAIRCLLLSKWNKFIWPCLQQSWQQDTSIDLVSTALLLHNAGEALIT